MIRQKGITLVEMLISAAIVIFLLFTVFYTFGNILSESILIEKKVSLTNELDHRIKEYIISGEFDTSDDGDMSFNSLGVTNNIAEFKATNNNYNLDIEQKTFYSDDEDIVEDIVEDTFYSDDENTFYETICRVSDNGRRR